jgi:hypothetical protein
MVLVWLNRPALERTEGRFEVLSYVVPSIFLFREKLPNGVEKSWGCFKYYLPRQLVNPTKIVLTKFNIINCNLLLFAC